jgi:starch synthase (maltosyl-transferring)
MTSQTGVTALKSALFSLRDGRGAARPRIYMLHPLLAGPLSDWGRWLDGAAALGFTHVLTAPLFAGPSLLLAEDFDRAHPALGGSGSAGDALRLFAEACRARGLTPLLDVYPSQLAAAGRVAQDHPELFRPGESARSLDPRRYGPVAEAAEARWWDAAEALGAFWSQRLVDWQNAGIAGFRLDLKPIATAVRPAFVARLRAEVEAALLGWTPGLTRDDTAALAGQGLDFVFSSLPWWDFHADWLWEEAAVLRRVAPAIAAVEDPYGVRLGASLGSLGLLPAAQRRVLRFAAAFGDGLLMPMGFEASETRPWDPRRDSTAAYEPDAGLAADIQAVNGLDDSGIPRILSGPDASALAFVRSTTDLRFADRATLAIVNIGLRRRRTASLAPFIAATGGRFELEGLAPDATLTLEPAELRMVALVARPAVTVERPPLGHSALRAAQDERRIGIERITPSVDQGRFAAKRMAGEVVTVEADILCDGHDQLGVALRWRRAGEESWAETRMRLINNDRWQAGFPLPQVGLYEFVVQAWRDAFASFRDELSKKHNAAVDVSVELIEGRHLVAEAGAPLAEVSDRLQAADINTQIALLLSADVASLMMAADPRPFAVCSPVMPIDADRAESRFAGWYEIFPRSMSDDPNRHGTFRDVERHLPRIRDMGFDVLYFPPIHPIGQANRKGRNNALNAAAGDVGSPYAIGGEAGGHDALHPELGSLADFQHLREAAAEHGLEIALDFAIQCAPDHPWLREHRAWFAWRPDGSIKYAENPPKKYQDIVNVDFYAKGAAPGLWVALAEVVLFWCEQGVRIFRVDNPHTKPFPFWEWLIAEVRAQYPGTLFLAEAFTRPKIMNRLGKIGFSQSYTYFTWRNTRAELEEYLTTLTAGPEADFFRPNFFVNTPDINPAYLQTSGRAGHLVRAGLAATLSGLWGVYSGFELCEATPLPGREEYLDSEKYQIRAWDWNRPGNIVAEITALNRIRRQNPALQSHLGLTFLPSDNDQIMIYEKATPDRSNVVVIAVNLDPHGFQAANTEIPFYKWGVPDQGTLPVTDLIAGRALRWSGKWQRVTLDPVFPFALWRVQPETP